MSSNRFLLIPVILFSALAPTVLLVAPAIAGQLAAQFHWSPGQIGAAISAELGAMSVATFPAYYWLKRVDWRKATLFAGLLFAAANLLAALVDSAESLIALRFVSGLAGGSMMIICISAAALAANPPRAYGSWLMGQIVFGALGFQVLPSIFAAYGIAGVYAGLAGLMLLILPSLYWLPAAGRTAPVERKASISRPAIAGIVGAFLFYIGLSAVWTFVGMIGAAASLAQDDIATVLSVATLAGIVGAGAASYLGDRNDGNRLLTTLGYAAMISAILALLGLPDLLRYFLAALCFKFSWTLILPYILAGISRADNSGQLINTTNLVIGGGLATGPLVGGVLIEVAGLSSVPLFGAVLVGCSFLLVSYLISRREVREQFVG